MLMKQKEDFRTVDFEDVMLWPDGTWCYRYELNEFKHKSDDYLVIFFATVEYDEFFERVVDEKFPRG